MNFTGVSDIQMYDMNFVYFYNVVFNRNVNYTDFGFTIIGDETSIKLENVQIL